MKNKYFNYHIGLIGTLINFLVISFLSAQCQINKSDYIIGEDIGRNIAYVESINQTTSGVNDLENQRKTIRDIDGNSYKTVKIGDQLWMAENLKTTRLNDGTGIELITDNEEWRFSTAPAYCWYSHDEVVYKETYGALYNWYTVNTGKLCPAGWHVPSNDDWLALENFLIKNGYNFDGSTSGNKIAKSLASKTHWDASSWPGTIGNNDYPEKRNATGFTALPGGYRFHYGAFHAIGSNGLWWTSTANSSSPSDATLRYMIHDFTYLHRRGNSMRNGYSVRCIKD
jgi:uncharacterized protein (TIGR02145 family)